MKTTFLLPFLLLLGATESIQQKSREILSEYNYYGGDEYYEKAVRHNVLVKQLMDGSSLVLGFTGSENAQCTACSSYLSVLVFDSEGNPIEHYNKVAPLNTRGRIDFILAEDEHKFESHEYFNIVEVREFAGKPFILLHTAFSQYVESFDNIYVYTKVNGKFKQVGDLQTGYKEQIRDPEYDGDELYQTDWKANVSFKLKKNNFPDIILNKYGKKNHKAFQDTEIYEFKNNFYNLKKN
jgi:hypothetical protein